MLRRSKRKLPEKSETSEEVKENATVQECLKVVPNKSVSNKETQVIFQTTSTEAYKETKESKRALRSRTSDNLNLQSADEKKEETNSKIDATEDESVEKLLLDQVFIGGHVSIAGGVHHAVANALRDGARAFALFLKSQRQWQAKPLSDEDASKFRLACEDAGYTADVIVPHGSYLLNLGSPDERKLRQSRESYVDELQRCEKLGLKLHNVHPGSTCGESPVEECLQRIATSINLAHSQTSSCVTLLENMSRQGNTVGGSFEQLRCIIDAVHNQSRVGVCLDTCHLFAAGYDIRSEEAYEATMKEFDDIIGFKYLKAVHLNDSKGALGCHLDRHEKIGLGQIGKAAFRRLLHDPRFRRVPLVLETPTDNERGYAAEIKVLQDLLKHS